MMFTAQYAGCIRLKCAELRKVYICMAKGISFNLLGLKYQICLLLCYDSAVSREHSFYFIH